MLYNPILLLLGLTLRRQFESNVDLREQSSEITTDIKEILQEVKQHGDTPSTLVVDTRTNSGNTTTTTISDSNNDSISYGGE